MKLKINWTTILQLLGYLGYLLFIAFIIGGMSIKNTGALEEICKLNSYCAKNTEEHTNFKCLFSEINQSLKDTKEQLNRIERKIP